MQSAMVLAVLLERNSSIAQLTKQQQQRPPDVLRRHVYAINSRPALLLVDLKKQRPGDSVLTKKQFIGCDNGQHACIIERRAVYPA